MKFVRITMQPQVMGGEPCIRGMRVTVGMILGLLASGETTQEILKRFPYLEENDIKESLEFAAWRLMEYEVELSVA